MSEFDATCLENAIPVSHWSIMRVDGADYSADHLVDVLPDDLLEREHSRVIDHDPDAHIVTTGSGRRYQLVDAPELSPESRHTFELWRQKHDLEIAATRNVSYRYCPDPESARNKLEREEAAWVADVGVAVIGSFVGIMLWAFGVIGKGFIGFVIFMGGSSTFTYCATSTREGPRSTAFSTRAAN